MENYNVYVRADDAGRVTAIDSSAFLVDLTGWTQIDEGNGDRYHHAQGNYLPGPLMDAQGRYLYKMAGGAVVARTDAEIAADETAQTEPNDQVMNLTAMMVDMEYRVLLLEMEGMQA